MPKEPTEQELEVVRRTAVLAVAVLTYPKMAAAFAALEDEPGSAPELTWTSAWPSCAFDAAEAFVTEAERRGYGPAALMQLYAGLGA